MGRLDNYDEVKDRLPRFWSRVKNGRIVTKVLGHSENWDRVTFLCELYEGETLIATGTAMDWKDKDRNANKTNWVEVAETSAIGRAIANSRYQDPNAARPSREEMEVAFERQDAASPETQTARNPDSGSAHPLIQLIEEHKLTDKVVTNFFNERKWINQGKQKGQSWTEASKEKLDEVYGRAKKNPKGFVEAIAA